MNKIKTGDQVMVLAGKDKGQTGKVIRVLTNNKVLVENINMAKRHTKGNPQAGVAGGIIEKEMPLHLSNVGLVNPATGKADRVGFKTLEDGRKVRFFKSDNEVVDA